MADLVSQTTAALKRFTKAPGADLDDDFRSDITSVRSDAEPISYEKLQGMDEQENKGEPVKGRYYMLYTIFAMLFLLIIVGANADYDSLNEAAFEAAR